MTFFARINKEILSGKTKGCQSKGHRVGPFEFNKYWGIINFTILIDMPSVYILTSYDLC